MTSATTLPANTRKLTDEGLSWLKKAEGFRLKPYDDQTGRPISEWCKGATIGYGHLIPSDQWGMYKNGFTQYEALDLLEHDMERFYEAVEKCDPENKLQPHEFDALVVFAFNVGVKAFTSSTLFRLIKEKSAVGVEKAWKSWIRSGGKVMQGLINRRDAEWDMFSRGVYRHW